MKDLRVAGGRQHLNDHREVDHPVERRLIDTDGANFVGGEPD